MAEIIQEARVWTKVDTLENWNNNPLLLGPGEMALVTNDSGIPLNMKWGDKTERKRFSDLPFAIAYDQGQFVAVSGTSLPASDGNVHYSLVGEGTYTRAGQSDVVVPVGDMGIIVDDGTTWSLASSVTLPTAPVASTVVKSGTQATSQDAVWQYNKDIFNASVVPTGQNIFQGIRNNDFFDNTALGQTNNTVASTGWKTLKMYIPIVAGTYTTNIFLTAATYLITFDIDFNIVNTYSNKGTSDGSTNWTFTIGSNEKYIRFCYNVTTPSLTTTFDFTSILPSVILETNMLYKLFIQNTDYDKIGKASERFKPFLGNITKAGFDPRAFVDIRLIQGTVEQLKTSGSWKDLYVVYQRYITLDGVATTLFQIGEKVGTSVGVNLNLIASYSGALAEDSSGKITLELNQANNSGIRFVVTIDTKYLRKGVDTSFDLGGTIQLNTRYFESQAIQIKQNAIAVSKEKPFLKVPFVDTFDYRSIMAVEPTIANPTDLDGLDLYITFLRIKGFDGPSTTTIVQISKLVSGTYIIVATCSLDKEADANGIIQADLTPSNDSNLWFRVVIDTKYLKQGTDTLQPLNNKVRLNIPYLISRSKEYYKSLFGVRCGDSTTEFNTASQMSRNLGARLVNGGLGGTCISTHPNEHYNAISFHNIATAIATGDWASVDAAVLYIKNNLSDDNTPVINRLKATDFTKVDFMNIGYGTNDFAMNGVIGTPSLSNVDTSNVSGALNYAIGVLQTAFPKMKIFIITPTHRLHGVGNSDSDTTPNDNGKFLIEYVDAIKQVAELNHIPVKDMYREGHFNKYNHAQYFADGVHPNPSGYEMLDNIVSNFIKSKLF